MKYDAKYKNMQDAVERFYNVSRSLDGYSKRLNNVKSQLGLFTSLLGYRNSVAGRSNAVAELYRTGISAGQCLDNARIEYFISERQVYQFISGDRSFRVTDGVAPVNIPIPSPNIKPPWWNLLWDFIMPPVINVGPVMRTLSLPLMPLWFGNYAGMLIGGGVSSGSITGWNIGVNITENNRPSLWNYITGKEKISDSFSWAKLTSGAVVLSLLNANTSFSTESGKGKINTWKPDDFKPFYEKNSDAKYAESKGGISIFGIGGKKKYHYLKLNMRGNTVLLAQKLAMWRRIGTLTPECIVTIKTEISFGLRVSPPKSV